MTSHFIRQPNGNHIHVNVMTEGEPNGLKLLSPPGYRADHGQRPFSSLLDRTDRVAQRQGVTHITFDYEAHGLSDGDLYKVGLGTFFRNLWSVYKGFCDDGVGQTVIVGHSIGAWFSPLLAHKAERRRPGSIGAIIAQAPTLDLRSPSGYASLLLQDQPDLQGGLQPRQQLETEGLIYSPLGAKLKPPMFYHRKFLRDAERLDLTGRYIRRDSSVRADRGALFDPSAYEWQPHPPLHGVPAIKTIFVNGADDIACRREAIEQFVGRLGNPDNVEIVTRVAEPHANGRRVRRAEHGHARESDLDFLEAKLESIIEMLRPYFDPHKQGQKPAQFART